MNAFIDHLCVGPLQTNCYVLGCPETKDAVIIDCGASANALLGLAQEAGYQVKNVWLTHAHIDHVGGLPQLMKLLNDGNGVPISMHPNDQKIYQAAKQMGMMFGYNIDSLPPVDVDLEDGQEIQIGNLKGSVHHFPGHSPGCVVFFFPELKTAFSGDLLFKGSIGRVDLPGSSPNHMRESLKKLKTAFPDDTKILCGHGPVTTLGAEKARNPYLTQHW